MRRGSARRGRTTHPAARVPRSGIIVHFSKTSSSHGQKQAIFPARVPPANENCARSPLTDFHTGYEPPTQTFPPGIASATMATKGPYDQDTWSPWLTKVIYKAPKAMSLQAFKMALLKKRLEEAKATAAAAASSKAVKEEAKEDIKAIRAELLAAKEREEQSKHADAYKEAKEEADDARESADKAQRKVERLREEFEEEAAEIRAKSKREQEARAKALQERERKRAEQRTKLEEELAARESERHKQVLKLKEVLKEHADAKKRIAEEDAPEEGEVDLNPASARATPASGARGGSLAAHIASADNSRDGPSPSPHYRADGPAPSPHYRQDSNQGLDRWGSGTPGSGPGGWGTPGVDAGGPYGHRPRMGMGMGMGMGMSGEIRAGDWMCPKGCGNVFASKMRCFRCGTPKPGGPPARPRMGGWDR